MAFLEGHLQHFVARNCRQEGQDVDIKLRQHVLQDRTARRRGWSCQSLQLTRLRTHISHLSWAIDYNCPIIRDWDLKGDSLTMRAIQAFLKIHFLMLDQLNPSQAIRRNMLCSKDCEKSADLKQKFGFFASDLPSLLRYCTSLLGFPRDGRGFGTWQTYED